LSYILESPKKPKERPLPMPTVAPGPQRNRWHRQRTNARRTLLCIDRHVENVRVMAPMPRMKAMTAMAQLRANRRIQPPERDRDGHVNAMFTLK